MTKIAIAISEFNQKITDELLEGALQEAHKHPIATPDVFKVPGAIELPFTAQQLAKTKKYNAIVLLGCVIQGETNHYDYICMQVSQATQQVMLQYNIPVIFGVLTTQNAKQAMARAGGAKGNTGCYALKAAMTMVKLQQKILAAKTESMH